MRYFESTKLGKLTGSPGDRFAEGNGEAGILKGSD